jgi:hypothetical protein
MHEQGALNKEKSYTSASFTEKDMAYCIEVAQMLSQQPTSSGLSE